MKLLLRVDCREHALLQELQNLPSTIQGHLVIERASLQLGDAHVVAEAQAGRPLFILERKTAADLAASIADGRYREQGARLAAAGLPPRRVAYILEGSAFSRGRHCRAHNPKSLCGALFSLCFAKGFGVLQTKNVHETACLLALLVNKVERDFARFVPLEPPVPPEPPDLPAAPAAPAAPSKEAAYLSCMPAALSGQRMANLRPDNFVLLALMQVPRVSEKSAAALAQRFATVRELVAYLEAHDGKLPADVRLASGRRVAAAALHNVATFLGFGSPVNIIEKNKKN